MRRLTFYIRKYPLAFISFLYFFSHLTFITVLPIFNDEAIYINWGINAMRANTFLFYSLSDAKPPLIIWLFGIFQTVIPDPLVAGRSVSMCVGFITLVGLYKIGNRFFGKKVGILTAFFYAFTPLFFLYDRQALMESAVGAVGIWVLYYIIVFVRENKAHQAIILGLILGMGIWIKYNALIFLFLSLVITGIAAARDKSLPRHWSYYPLLMLSVCLVVLLPLLCNSLFWKSAPTVTRYSLSLRELLHFPFGTWLRNVTAVAEVIFWQLTPPVLLTAGLGMIFFFRQKSPAKLVLFWFITGILMAVITARNLGARYIEPYLPIVMLLFSYGATELVRKQRIFGILVLCVSLLSAVSSSMALSIAPDRYFSLLSKYSGQSQVKEYVTGWESGYGIPETVDYLQQELKQPSLLMLPPETGNPQSAMLVYFSRSPIVSPLFMDQSVIKGLSNYQCITAEQPIYFVSRDGDMKEGGRFFQELKRFHKPDSSHFIGVYKSKSPSLCRDSEVFTFKIKSDFFL